MIHRNVLTEKQGLTPKQLLEERNALHLALKELLHWIYPREGDGPHRSETFVDEAKIGFRLIQEDHPFAEPEDGK
jgi:hypothetical protein